MFTGIFGLHTMHREVEGAAGSEGPVSIHQSEYIDSPIYREDLPDFEGAYPDFPDSSNSTM